MFYRGSESLLEMAHIESIASCYERVAGSDSHCNRVHALKNGRSRHRSRVAALPHCRRSLTFCQTIDPIIVRDVGKVQISASPVNDVPSASAQPIGLVSHRPDR